jgi:hypothetical protein
MPGAVAEARLARAVLPLDELGPEIMKRARRKSAPAHGKVSEVVGP